MAAVWSAIAGHLSHVQAIPRSSGSSVRPEILTLAGILGATALIMSFVLTRSSPVEEHSPSIAASPVSDRDLSSVPVPARVARPAAPSSGESNHPPL